MTPFSEMTLIASSPTEILGSGQTTCFLFDTSTCDCSVLCLVHTEWPLVSDVPPSG